MKLNSTFLEKITLNFLKTTCTLFAWCFVTSMYSGSLTTVSNLNNQNVDTEAPTTPTGLSWEYDADNNATFISWNASTDNVGVSYYQIFEDGHHFYFIDRTKLGFGGKPKRSSTFTILAIDAAGNKSALSEPLVVSADVDPNPCNDIEAWR